MVGGTNTTGTNITSSCIDTILKYAIILNNIGVSLLEKHYYERSMIPLKDSLSLLRLLVAHEGCWCSKKNQQHIHTLVDTARKMHQCAIQLVSQTSLSLLSPNRLYKVVHFDSMYLSDTPSQQRLQQLQQSDNVVEVSGGQTIPSLLSNEKQAFTLLQLDEVPAMQTNRCGCTNKQHTTETDTCLMNDKNSVSLMTMMINIQSSIILHNTGLAAYCISKLKLVQVPAQQQHGQGWGQMQGQELEQKLEQAQARYNSCNHTVYHIAAIQSLQSSHAMYIKALQGLSSISSLSRTTTSRSSNTGSSGASSPSTSSINSRRSTTTSNRSCSDMSICPLTLLSGLVVITKSVLTSLQHEHEEEQVEKSKHILGGATTATVSTSSSTALTYYHRVLHDTQRRLTVLFKKKEQFGFITINTTAIAA